MAGDIDEVVYPTPHSYEQAQQIADTSSEGANCLEGKPNSYTYSKALAENIILETRGAIPTAIVRPSIVISSLKEPCPGWIDNWNGATGYFVGMSSGVLRVAIGRSWNVADFIPVDIVTNLTIVAAARCQRSNELKVYNCCSGKSNPITYREALNICRRITFEHSLNDLPWPFLLTTSSHTVYYILNLFLHILPAFLADLWSVFVGRPSRNMIIQMKLMKMVHALKHFVLNEWNFSDGNVRELWKSLPSCDQELFNFDVKSIIWERCFEDYLLGARKFLLKK